MTKIRTMALLALLLLILASGEARALTPQEASFLQAEAANDYIAKDSTVDPRYRNGQEFDVRYIEVPTDRLNLETAKDLTANQRAHLYAKKDGQNFVRFFVHPDSEHLYAPLIKEFGWAGAYRARATASTRTVLAWDPNRADIKPVFLKLSLAQLQDDLGRVVPGWEVRRSVRIAEAWQKGSEKRTPNVKLIPEFAGAYLKEKEGIGFYVDKDQGKVFEHGFIMRDAEFLNTKNKLVPMFWFFSHNGGAEPPIISLWKKSGMKSFEQFLAERFFDPIIKMNLPLMLTEGIVPQIHGQNVVLEIDPKTLDLKGIFHRDIGSMKADYRLRWVSGLSIDPLQSVLADKDFGLSWGAGEIEKFHINYLHNWQVLWSYLEGIRQHVPGFNPDVSERLMLQLLQKRTSELTKAPPWSDTTRSINSFIDENIPAVFEEMAPIKKQPPAVADFLRMRQKAQQSVDLPKRWGWRLETKFGPRKYFYSDYGVIHWSGSGSDGRYKIAFFDSPERKAQMRELLAPPKASSGTCASGFAKLSAEAAR